MAQIYITQPDNDKLRKLLINREPHDDYDRALLHELERAQIVKPYEIPPDVITMNSHVRFEDDMGHEWEYWLVYPEDTDLKNGRVSILSPIGCALLGYRIGDKVTVFTPGQGRRDLIVKEIMVQPERVGAYHL